MAAGCDAVPCLRRLLPRSTNRPAVCCGVAPGASSTRSKPDSALSAFPFSACTLASRRTARKVCGALGPTLASNSVIARVAMRSVRPSWPCAKALLPSCSSDVATPCCAAPTRSPPSRSSQSTISSACRGWPRCSSTSIRLTSGTCAPPDASGSRRRWLSTLRSRLACARASSPRRRYSRPRLPYTVATSARCCGPRPCSNFKVSRCSGSARSCWPRCDSTAARLSAVKARSALGLVPAADCSASAISRWRSAASSSPSRWSSWPRLLCRLASSASSLGVDRSNRSNASVKARRASTWKARLEKTTPTKLTDFANAASAGRPASACASKRRASAITASSRPRRGRPSSASTPCVKFIACSFNVSPRRPAPRFVKPGFSRRSARLQARSW